MNNPKHTCLICKSDASKSFLVCTDNFVSGEQYNLHQCTNCGFIFTADAPSFEKMAPYYASEEYISHSDIQKGIVNRLYHKVRDIMLRKKLKTIQNETSGRVLLDIGCGTGYFPNFMKENGYQASGMELDADARKFAAENFGLDVSSPDELLTKEVNEQYDVITLWHVLEHLHDVNGYLNWIKKALKSDGVLLIALPNCNAYDAKLYGKYWAAYDVPRHLWHFIPKTFETYLSQFDFNLLKIKRLPFDAFYNCLLSARYAGKFLSLAHGLMIGCISNFFSFMNVIKASSVIYILKKPI